MKRAWLLLIAACSAPAKPAPPVPVEPAVTRTCAEAAAGLERGTRDVRAPEESVLLAMRTRCIEDGWSAAAIECFAVMQEGGLGSCAGKLAKDMRERMFGALGGNGSDRTAIAVAKAKLDGLKVGVPECERFVTTVANVINCEGLALDVRVQLGNETADFWSLPTSGLAPDLAARMAAVCSQSLAALQQRAADAGCMP